jgi:hypothetical protein
MMTTTLTLTLSLGKPAMEQTPSCSFAFWASIGFKPGDFMTIGMNEKRAAWHCRVLNRVTHPA